MPKNIKRIISLLTSLKAIIGVLGVSTYLMHHEKIAFWILVSDSIIDESIKFLTKEIELKKDNVN